MCEDGLYFQNVFIKHFFFSLLEMHMKKMMQQCCACGEAKYQLTFKGLWSAQTHKKDWPSTNGKKAKEFDFSRFFSFQLIFPPQLVQFIIQIIPCLNLVHMPIVV